MTISTELKVGVFSTAGVATLMAMIVLLDGNPFAAKAQEFYTELENVGGVGVRTQVRTSGVQVGEVVSIDVLPTGARVNFHVRADVQIPEGTYLELRSRGILGDVFIELVRNTHNPKILGPSSLIPKRAEANDFNSLMNLVGSIARDLQSVSRSLALVFGSTDGQSSLQNIVHNVEKISAEARELMTGQRYNIAKAIQGLRDAATQLSDLLNRNSTNIDDAVKSVSVAAKDVQYFTAELRKLVTGKNEGKLTNILDSIDSSASNIRTSMAKVELIVDKVQKGEGSLGQIVSRDDTANELRATLKNVQELLAPARRLRVEVDYKGEVRGVRNEDNYTQFGNHFNFRLSTTPDHFYLLGVSDSLGGRQVTTTTTQTTGAGTPTTVTREVQNTDDQRSALRFNVQYAKRFSPFGLRFGLFESYPGIAADAYMFADRLTASVEAFQFTGRSSNDRRSEAQGYARVKAYSNFFVTPNLYLTGGVDGVGRNPGPFGFAGGGVRFTDDDIKAVLGAAALAK